MLRVSLLGPLEVTGAGGAPVELPGGKPRLLLAVLACHANRPVSAEMLAESLWGPAPPRRAGTNLRVYVHHLRKALGGDRIGRRPEGYVLFLEPGELDAERFRALVAQARAAVGDERPGRAAEALSEALALWRGPALAGLDSAWLEAAGLAADAAGLEEQRLQALELRFEVELGLGRPGGVIAELRALTTHYPLRETFRGLLMRALIGDGRGAEALAVFESTRRVLADELGLDPSRSLRDLHLAVLRSQAQEGTADEAPRPAAVVPRQLPARAAGFAGRDESLARLDALVADAEGGAVPIATISGAGGVGKTTLAVHWAHAVAERFPDGQLYLNLHGFDPVRPPAEPAAALGVLLTALGVAPREVPVDPAERENLYRSLVAGRRVLVVLDNAHDAAQVRPLLPGGAGCMVLVTSRDLLTGLVAAGARPLVLDPLDTAEAYDLLERRLGAVRMAAEPAAVAALIARCGGLPLALSVVAARAAVVSDPSLAALADELGRPHRALDGFSGDDEATDPRSVFSWSYRILEPPAARLFRLLSAHPGPEFTAGAAAGLAGVHLEAARVALRQLRVASLLTEASPGRYGFHDLIRAYAVELAEATEPAAERAAALSRLLDHLVHTAYPAALLIDPNQTPTPIDPPAEGVAAEPVEDRRQALAWFDAERAVLLAAVERARPDFPAQAWQLACSCVVYLERTGRWSDKLAVLSVALETARRTGARAIEARTLRSLGRTLGRLHRHDEAAARLREAIELYRDLGDGAGLAHATATLGELLEHAGRPEEAMALNREACELYRAAGHVVGEARSLGGIASLLSVSGRYREAIDTGREALPLFERVGDRVGIAGVQDTIGLALHHLGAHDDAVQRFGLALEAMAGTGEQFYVALVLRHMGDAFRAAQDVPAARERYRQALAIYARLGAREAAGVRERLAALDHSPSAR
ncbi:AfsR/SARP family transcriptional regulator [Dactylosporangium salmoneum]|uniref:BTAD domain-containing putative transcriptional regulator n=1 Tax=Dactylosporangium salmoneum TaxID=53361 RepID=A0ABP5UZC5_9ACTN